jgi:hypothetical protein
VYFDNGIPFLSPSESIKFSFASTDKFNLLTADISQAADGDYFEYQAKWNGQSIEDFIFQLNSVAGNNYYLIHELRLQEQVGISFTETDNVSSIQNNRYDIPKKYRPVLELADSAISFTIDYTIRLFNAADGRSVFKTASLTSTDINKYGKSMLKLNVGDTTQPIKIYNKTAGNPTFNISDQLLSVTKTKVVSRYIDVNSITVKSDSDVNKNIDGLQISINPFDNTIKLNLSYKYSQDEDDTRLLDLDTLSRYYMVFIKNDGSKLYIDELIDDNFRKSRGELAFKIGAKAADQILQYSNQKFYVISRTNMGNESIIFSGDFIKS